MRSCLSKLTFLLPFLREFPNPFSVSLTSLCSVLALHWKTALLDAHQLVMLPESTFYIIWTFYNNYGCFYLLVLDINSIQCKFILISFSLSPPVIYLWHYKFCYHPEDTNYADWVSCLFVFVLRVSSANFFKLSWIKFDWITIEKTFICLSKKFVSLLCVWKYFLLLATRWFAFKS